MIGELLTAFTNSWRPNRASPTPPATVAAVDLARYAGRWYEIARLPNPEQDGGGRHCVDVVATYTRRPDGSVDVVNTARDTGRGGRRRGIRGRARKVDPSGAKLRLTIFAVFGGAYWVLGLDPEYRWALVGTPSRRRLWVLGRSPSLDADTYRHILSIAAAQGYDTGRIRPTPQSDSVPAMDSTAIRG